MQFNINCNVCNIWVGLSNGTIVACKNHTLDKLICIQCENNNGNYICADCIINTMQWCRECDSHIGYNQCLSSCCIKCTNKLNYENKNYCIVCGTYYANSETHNTYSYCTRCIQKDYPIKCECGKIKSYSDKSYYDLNFVCSYNCINQENKYDILGCYTCKELIGLTTKIVKCWCKNCLNK